ncbi:tectonin domain-containing protein [Sinomonas sp. ASV322]|uniref:tectonin domain-containing protein n=1 Tax=Sinomonas sp. ASV322 TaxID=3041920 RepID=UPI0027DBDC88|nr:tectonin domain-containing protein [Sinomonas sp. ASV322]MDQ4504551.1 tectonin domain-containing protein [Sinomonas sp. ASV322]
MRPKSAVHEVRPGEVVTGEGLVVAAAGEAAIPAGMAPSQEVVQKESLEATPAAEPAARPAEPVGMRPGGAAESTSTGGMPAEADEELVVTPGGYRKRSLVHEIGPDHVLDLSTGTVKQMHISGREVADFGPIEQRDVGRRLMPDNVALRPGIVPGLATGWIAYADWSNTTGNPITRFATSWVVPPAPSTNHSQTIYLFNGIQNSTMIYQPVLQWGPSPAGGGSSWNVASWYADGQGGPAFHSSLAPVSSGQVITGVITLTGQSGASFSYNCEFIGIANTSLPITNVQELTWSVETLEAYGLQQCSDYPAAMFTSMWGIDLSTTAGRPAITWSPVNAVTDCGQSAHVVSNANPGGAVELYYSTRAEFTDSTAAINSDGRLETFLRDVNGGVWNIWQTVPHSGPWSWTNLLGGIVITPVQAALNTDGRLEIFGIGTDHAAYNMWQMAPHAGPWSGWNRLGGWVSRLAVALNSDGRLELFGIGGDGALYNMWQTAPHSGPWSGWNRLGGWVKEISAIDNSDGRLEVFGIGGDGALYNMWQTVPHAGPWSNWNRLGGWVSQIAASINSDGRLEVFGIGGDGALYNMWQTVPHAGPWSNWNRLGGWVSQIVPALNSDGRLEVFGIGGDGALYNMWQTVPHAGPWSNWNRLGGWVSHISAALNSDGRLEVFGIGGDRELYNIWQTVPHAGPWSGWNKLT